MTRNLLNALADLGLLPAANLSLLDKFGVNPDTERVSPNPIKHPGLKEFYSALSRLESFDIDTAMTIAEEHLSDVPLSGVGNESLSGYDLLRHKMLMGEVGKFLIVYGSLSGIQHYLFDVKSSRALKQLRGRSFYLYLLQDAVVERALCEFGVTRQTVLYSTGGTFCMLIPYREGIEEQFNRFKNNITASIFKAHQQNLVLLNSHVATTEDLKSRLADIFASLHQQKNKDKHTPLCDTLQAMYEACFNPQDRTHQAQRDESAENLGTVLGKMKYILAARQEQALDSLLVIDPADLGVKYHFLSSCALCSKADKNASLAIIAYNENAIPNTEIGCRREYFAGIGASAQSFSDLLDKDAAGGIKRLGVLRMDVDNLGNTLRKCYERENALAHFAKTSRKLDVFFKKELNQLWYQHYKETSVIVYSGGDDLFIVGEWSTVIAMAQEINQRYRTFFAEPNLTLSGGISVVEEKFPIIRAAEYSAEEENNAKKFSYTDARGICREKNALSIFGMPLRWDVEWPIVNEIYQRFSRLIAQNEQTYHPILRRILKYFEIVRFENRQIVPIRQVWLMTYDLSRAIRRIEVNIGFEDKQFITQCKDDLVTGVTMQGKRIDSPYHALQLWAIAARLVELTTRNN